MIYLDTAQRNKKVLKVGNKEFSTESSIFKLLTQNVKNPQQIEKVNFNRGPGSFTGLKVGASIANAINYALGKIKVDEVELPEYGKKPNIG